MANSVLLKWACLPSRWRLVFTSPPIVASCNLSAPRVASLVASAKEIGPAVMPSSACLCTSARLCDEVRINVSAISRRLFVLTRLFKSGAEVPSTMTPTEFQHFRDQVRVRIMPVAVVFLFVLLMSSFYCSKMYYRDKSREL